MTYPVPADRQRGYAVQPEDWNQLAGNSNDANQRLNAVDGRVDRLETNQGTRGGRAAIYDEIDATGARLDSLETTSAEYDGRLDTLEAIPPGQAITLGGFITLTGTGGNTGFKPTAEGAYQVVRVSGFDYQIAFENPGVPVTVYGAVGGHIFSSLGARGGLIVQISFDGGATWLQPEASPLGGTTSGGSTTAALSAQYAVSGTPTGPIGVQAAFMRQWGADGELFRATLYAQVLGGAGATYNRA